MADTDLAETATAHVAWDQRWQREDERALWRTVDPDVQAIVPVLETRGARCVLDLGCGIGRHALFLAAAGFEVDATDGSPSGLAEAEAEAERRGLRIRFRRALMTALPYGDASFDYVLAWNVIYHGSPDVLATVISEVKRVTRQKAPFQGTMLSKRNAKYGLGRCIAADTYVIDGEEDKAHPHFYCDEAGVHELFRGFTITYLVEREHRTPGSWHWHFVAERQV